jgi:nitric oxide reductase subunit B
MDHGSVWGHGSQRGSEFSATTLHIVTEVVGDFIAEKDYGKSYSDINILQKELVDVKTKNEIKTNRYNQEIDTLTLTPAQVKALERVQQHWDKTFKNGELRYGFLPNTIADAQQRLQVSRFFFWTAWVASTLRPGKDYTYTNNWPSDRRAGNVASTQVYFWSIGGVLSLLLVLGIFIYLVHSYGMWYGPAKGVPLSEKLVNMPLTPS